MRIAACRVRRHGVVDEQHLCARASSIAARRDVYDNACSCIMAICPMNDFAGIFRSAAREVIICGQSQVG